MMLRHQIATGVMGWLLAASLAGAAEARVSYNRDIRPLFSETCFKCHGPDSNHRKADLRLDQADSAFARAKSGKTPIVPGDAEQSEVVRRITAAGDDAMPPADEHKTLKPAEVAMLREWINQGAKYEGHWSFAKVVQPQVPAVDAADAFPIRNPIDAFILTKLRQQGLSPSPAEDRARLIRRASLDLTGLPPTIEEVDAFVADASPDAFEKVVDRLLASPHFGERMAVPWLDLARHSDTAGYHNDSLRTTWLWRDWVVQSFNDDKPFDRFTVEQIAGDLLPHATTENKIASGFMRNVMTSDEGGIIPEEYLNLYLVDRVNTLGATWLGMTVACAQCHDHKYDPITQRDYYSLYAFFNAVPELGKDGVRDRNPVPNLFVASPQQQKQIEEIEALAKAADEQAKQLAKDLDARQAAWEKQLAAGADLPEPAGARTRFLLEDDGVGFCDDGRELCPTRRGNVAFAADRSRPSLQTGDGWLDCGQQFGFDKDDAFSASAWVSVSKAGGSPFGKMDATPRYRGWDMEFHGTRPSVHLIHQWPNEAIHVQAEEELPAGQFVQVGFSYDGSGKASGVKLYVNGAQAKVRVLVDNLSGSMKTPAPFSIGRRGESVPFHGKIADLRIYPRALEGMDFASLGGSQTLKVARLAPSQRSAAQASALQKFFRENVATDYVAATRKAADLRRQRDAFERGVPNTLVMAEMDKPRDTFIKVRGQYDKNGEPVTANTPHFLPPLPEHPANGVRYTRLDLAQWLVSPDHPLVARVEANRLWAIIFGGGIVKSVNDFGSQGEYPVHPELLDWLAADFSRDWSIKRAVRQMVLSSAYRQSSRVSDELLERDSANRLLARGPRNRLDAEFIRDNALAISGLLNPELGGKPVFPAQPPGIWEINDMGAGNWKQQHDAGQYRRAIYIYHRRSTPYPSMLTFDAPSREVCTAYRQRTSTPLQSLVLMNDPVYVEAARSLAQRTLAEASLDPSERLEHLWRLALARRLSDAERAILERTLSQQLEKYRADKQAADRLIHVGDLPRPANVPPAELAAWTAVASVVLNLNETITN